MSANLFLTQSPLLWPRMLASFSQCGDSFVGGSVRSVSALITADSALTSLRTHLSNCGSDLMNWKKMNWSKTGELLSTFLYSLYYYKYRLLFFYIKTRSSRIKDASFVNLLDPPKTIVLHKQPVKGVFQALFISPQNFFYFTLLYTTCLLEKWANVTFS